MSSSNKKAADRITKAAEMRAAQARREAQRRLLTILGVALVMIVIVGGAIVFSVVKNNHDNSKVEKAVAATGTSKYGVIIGPKSAKHHVVIYEDFLCPYCGALESGSRDEIAKLAADGDVQVEYRPFNWLGGSDMNSYSARATGAFSIVLDKSGAAVAKKFHDLLFENQPSESGPFPSNADLVKDAVEAGAKESQVKAPIEAQAGADWVEAATKEAVNTGLQGTPTIVVDGNLIQGTTAADLLAAVQ